jgi:hypothetical protein
MQLKGFDADHVSFLLSRHELATMHQALNEVCHGLRVVDFEAKMGSEKSETWPILKNIGRIYKEMKKLGDQDVEMSLSRRQLRAIIGAFEEVCREIDDIEFSTRMGAERGEVDQILEEIVPIYHQMKLM